jgi:hypothetical protein
LASIAAWYVTPESTFNVNESFPSAFVITQCTLSNVPSLKTLAIILMFSLGMFKDRSNLTCSPLLNIVCSMLDTNTICGRISVGMEEVVGETEGLSDGDAEGAALLVGLALGKDDGVEEGKLEGS